MKVGPRYLIVEPSLTRMSVVSAPSPIVVRQAFTQEQIAAAHEKYAAQHGAKLWGELHRRALVVSNGVDDSSWISRFTPRLPCGPCKDHWHQMLGRTPPDWSNYFSWTVDRHNEVNARLGKQQMSELEARDLWSNQVV